MQLHLTLKKAFNLESIPPGSELSTERWLQITGVSYIKLLLLCLNRIKNLDRNDEPFEIQTLI